MSWESNLRREFWVRNVTRTSSLPQTRRADSATVTPVTQPANRWIIGPWQDVLLFLGTPLLLIAAFGFAERYWSLAAVGVFSTVLAMGHYLPGLMRA